MQSPTEKTAELSIIERFEFIKRIPNDFLLFSFDYYAKS